MPESKTPLAIFVDARRWRDTHGNTYHTCTVTVVYPRPQKLQRWHTKRSYGYGCQYLQTALESLQTRGILPDSKIHNFGQYCRDNSISYIDTVVDVKRLRDL